MPKPQSIIVVGAGPAGLMAAQVLSEAGLSVTVYDRMLSPGRKFLMAGRGGLNLTHSEDFETFVTRYGNASDWLMPSLKSFSPDDLRGWCEKLGLKTFVGSSGRVFPSDFKASPLLRAWLRHLDGLGVQFHFGQQWIGWNAQQDLLFEDRKAKVITVRADAVLMALGGATWPRLGSDGNWVPLLREAKIQVMDLRPANCGFVVKWSEKFRSRCAGQPLKSIRMTFKKNSVRGEAMVTEAGLEGGVIYALSASLRDTIAAKGSAVVHLDLRPDLSLEQLQKKLEIPRGSQSISTYLRKAAGLSPVTISLVQEILHHTKKDASNSSALAALIKALPLLFGAPFSIDRAISTAGGVSRQTVDENFMLRQKPGVFVAGEMLDWEAPTGGYLLQGSFSTAVTASKGILKWLKEA